MTSNEAAFFKVPTLTGLDFFFQWKTAITDTLLMIGALDLVEGNEPRPTADKAQEVTMKTEATGGQAGPTPKVKTEEGVMEEGDKKDLETDIRAWISKDRKAMAVLRRSVSDGLKIDIEECRSAREIWLRLCALHDLSAPEYRAEVRREIHNYFMVDGTDFKAHLDGFLRLLLKASGAGIKYSDDEKCLYFLDTLPASFDMLKLQWRMQPDDKKTFTELRRQYNLEGAQRARTQARSTAAIMMAGGAGGAGGKSGTNNADKRKGQKTGQTIKPGSKKWQRDLSNVKCFRCNKTGHFKRDCKERQEAKDGDEDHRLNFVVPSNDLGGPFIGLASVAAVTEGAIAMAVAPGRSVWVVDSGATHHIVYDKALLQHTGDLKTPVRFGLAAREGAMVSDKVGRVVSEVGGARVVFTDVHLVEEARVSAPVLARKGWTVSLSRDSSFLKYDNLVLPLAERDGLFYLDVTELHERLGHMSKTRIKNMVRNGELEGIELLEETSKLCEPCQQAKSARHTFGEVTVQRPSTWSSAT